MLGVCKHPVLQHVVGLQLTITDKVKVGVIQEAWWNVGILHQDIGR
jgi:hypothetical protein